MGTDNLFHKRKARSAKQLSRRKAKRSPYAKVLIVCEGEKTEPHYFAGVQEYYELNTANIEITGETGSSPRSILSYARQRYREAKDAGDEFDKVFCVFDKDNHAGYYEVCQEIDSAVPKETFYHITSVPCFEYWLLLHFVYTTRPYESLPGNSSANQVLSDLRNYIPTYKKGDRGIFLALLEQLPQAKVYAQKTLDIAMRSGTDNPTTKVHHLVEFLQTIKDK